MELQIGRVIKSHGIKGEVVVDPTTDQPELRFAVGMTLHGKQAGHDHNLVIAAVRPHKNRLLITFEGIDDRNVADSLRGTKFFAEPVHTDDEDDGFYDHELEGLAVIVEGETVAIVTGVMHGPAGDILEAKLTSGKEVLIPFVHAIVPEVDLEKGQLIATPPEGLFDL